MQTTVQRLIKDTRGATFVEYIILVGLVALFCVTAYETFGGAVETQVEGQAERIGAIGTTGGN